MFGGSLRIWLILCTILHQTFCAHENSLRFTTTTIEPSPFFHLNTQTNAQVRVFMESSFYNCYSWQFRCNDGQCVSRHDLCDGWPKCRDGSDEWRKYCWLSYESIIPSRTTVFNSTASTSNYCDYWQFRCNDGQCISRYELCNGWQDCSDGSVEWRKNCWLSYGSIIPSRTTVSISTTSTSNYCDYWQFRCNNGQCIPRYELCDGRRQCYDGSDEWPENCRSSSRLVTPSGTTATVVTQSVSSCPFQCGNGQCIEQREVCDGYFNCYDKSDERDWLCRVEVRLKGPYGYRGVGRVEVYSYYKKTWGTVCDNDWDDNDATVVCRQLGYGSGIARQGRYDVPYGSGLILLDNVQCFGWESSISHCPHNPLGHNDCNHWEDAGVKCFASGSSYTPIMPSRTTVYTTSMPNYCDFWQFRCNDGQCIPRYDLCDGRRQCYDGSDEWSENGCRSSSEFIKPARTTIPTSSTSNYCNYWQFRCNNGQCISRYDLCNGWPQCSDGSDEWPENCGSSSEFIKPARTTVSTTSTRNYCGYWQFRCNNGQCIPRYELCNGWQDCSDGSDEWSENCWSSSKLIPTRATATVPTSSTSNYCDYWQFRCNNGQCIPRYELCDGRRQCYDGSDEWPENCRSSSRLVTPSGTTATVVTQSVSSCPFQCGNGQCIEEREVCDGYFNCYDKSDERDWLCRVEVRLKGPYVYRGVGRVEVYSYYKKTWGTVCDNDWDDNDATVVCRQLGYGSGIARQGRYDVPYGSGLILLDNVQCFGWESSISHCPHNPLGHNDCNHWEDAGVKCFASGSSYTPIMPSRTTVSTTSMPNYCDYWQFRCNDGQCIPRNDLCDGRRQCYDGSDEWSENCRSSSEFIKPARTTVSTASTRNYCGYWQFRCNNGQCIPRYELCNGWQDCSDGSDEWLENCWSPSKLIPTRTTVPTASTSNYCDYWQFRCNDGPCIPGYELCDGRRQCYDGSDEWSENCRRVRLNGPYAYKGVGVVEIYHGTWGTICDDHWDINDATVVCRQLGYPGAINALQGYRFPVGAGLDILLDEVHCRGTESFISDCRHSRWGVHNCHKNEAAGVECLLTGNLTKCQTKVDLGFILDVSSSVSRAGFQQMRTFVKDLTAFFDLSFDKTRVSVMTFSDQATIHIPFSQIFKNKLNFGYAVDKINYVRGGTATAMALKSALNEMLTKKNGARGAETKKVLVILTDGRSNNELVSGPAEQLQNAGVVIFAVGIGPSVLTTELYIMASEPKERRVSQLTLNDSSDRHSPLAKSWFFEICNASSLVVSCDSKSIHASFKRVDLPPHVNVERLHLRDRRCIASYNNTHVFFTLHRSQECGTIYETTDQQESYRNSLLEEKMSSSQNDTDDYTFFTNFTCTYDRLKTVGALKFLPTRQMLSVSRSDVGTMILSMKLFKTGAFNVAYAIDDYPVHQNFSESIYIQYSVRTSHLEAVVRAMTCRATPTNKPYDSPQYVFIANGCDNDTTIHHYNNGSNRHVQRFSIKPFSFLSQHQFVYIHCELVICSKKFSNSICVAHNSCSTSFKLSSSDDNSPRYTLSFGPMMYPKHSNPAKSSGDSKSNTVLTACLIAVGCLATIFAVAFICVLKRNRIRRLYARIQSSEVLTMDDVSYVMT